MKIINFNRYNQITEEDAQQLAKAIESFDKEKDQPKGRFEIVGILEKED